jgi:hypothetical protein
MRILLTNAGLSQSTNYTSQSSHCRCARQGGYEPTGCDDRANAGNSQHPEAGEKSRDATDGSANPGPLGCSFCPVVDPVTVPVHLARFVGIPIV